MKLEAFVIDLDGPITWAQFKRLPDDLQRDYLILLKTAFNANHRMIAEKWGISYNTVQNWYTRLHLAPPHGQCTEAHQAAWENFWKQPRWHQDLANSVQGALSKHPFLSKTRPKVRAL